MCTRHGIAIPLSSIIFTLEFNAVNAAAEHDLISFSAACLWSPCIHTLAHQVDAHLKDCSATGFAGNKVRWVSLDIFGLFTKNQPATIILAACDHPALGNISLRSHQKSLYFDIFDQFRAQNGNTSKSRPQILRNTMKYIQNIQNSSNPLGFPTGFPTIYKCRPIESSPSGWIQDARLHPCDRDQLIHLEQNIISLGTIGKPYRE